MKENECYIYYKGQDNTVYLSKLSILSLAISYYYDDEYRYFINKINFIRYYDILSNGFRYVKYTDIKGICTPSHKLFRSDYNDVGIESYYEKEIPKSLNEEVSRMLTVLLEHYHNQLQKKRISFIYNIRYFIFGFIILWICHLPPHNHDIEQ